jgi:hypothetical protein
VIVVSIGLVLAGAAAAVAWGGRPFATPWSDEPEPAGGLERTRRTLWYIDVHLVGAFATGLLVIGPGGRLVMRLLAATAGDRAQGRLTEADQVVGRVTVGGTIGLFIFVGLLGGFLLAFTAGVLRPWVPRGRLGALAVAAALLLTGATRNDPLRPENPDFDIVGPDWLAVTAFVALIVVAALSFEAFASRLSRSLPLADVRRPLTLLPYAPLLLLGLTGILPLAIVVVVAVAVGLGAVPALRAWWPGRIVTIGRVALLVAGALLVPALIGDLGEILRS